MHKEDTKSHVCMCQLDNGDIVEYDGADGRGERTDFYTPDKWKFIGTGVIYSINGVMQNSTRKFWFYVKVKP